jgi:hypothetical protein
MAIFFACCISLPTTRLSVTSEIGTRSSMMTRKPTVGGGADSSGACGPPSAWPVLRRLPWPRRSLAKAISGPEPGAQVLEPLHLTPALRAPTGRPSTFSSVFLCLSLSFCLWSLEVTVTSLHPPRLRRIAVFSIKPTFLSWKVSGMLCLSMGEGRDINVKAGAPASLR